MSSAKTSLVWLEARKFCETTSVRGVPRVVKSKSTGLFIIWLIGVVVCGGCLIWQVSLVLIRYVSYPVNTLYAESPDALNPTFPDITICNINPLVHEVDQSITYQDYLNTLDQALSYNKTLEFAAVRGYGNISQDFYDSLIYGYLITPSAYFNNFPINTHLPDDSTNVSMTLDCNLFYWNYSDSTTVCLDTIRPIWDPNYYKCYTYSVSDSERNAIRGFAGIYYVQGYQGNVLSPFFLDLISSHASGIRVLVHAPGTKPDMKLGLSVSPGTETTIQITQTLRTILPAPYGTCTTEATLGDVNITYTEAYCTDVCVQKLFNINVCRCLDSSLQFTEEQLASVNYTLCGNLSLNSLGAEVNWDYLDRFLTYETTLEDDSMCRVQCPPPCQEYQYDTSVSLASWPDMSSQLAFYQKYILDQSRYGTMFNDFGPLLESALDKNFSPNDSAALQNLYWEQVLQSSFLQLNIRFDSTKFNIQQDVAAFSKDAMGAQIGGVLSLWLGVTIMLLFEVIEFVYVLFAAYGRKQKSVSNVQGQQVQQTPVEVKHS